MFQKKNEQNKKYNRSGVSHRDKPDVGALPYGPRGSIVFAESGPVPGGKC